MRSAAAVDVRISLDLRVGAAFTRLQTMGLQSRLPELEQKVISYGKSRSAATSEKTDRNV
jgi:DNA topoisomerase-3